MLTVLAWCLLVVSPPAQYFAVVTGSSAMIGPPGFPLRLLMPLVAVALPFAVFRRHPLTAIGVMLASAVLVTTVIEGQDHAYLVMVRAMQFAAIAVAVGVIAANRRRRVSVVVAVVALLLQVAAEYVNSGDNYLNALATIYVFAMLTAWLAGNSVRARRENVEALRAQAAAQAVTAERLRIARELHDIVAHSISIIAIQAGVGARIIDSHPNHARAALETIEATSRETLAGLGRVLGGLRKASRNGAVGAKTGAGGDSGAGGGDEAGGTDAVGLAPAPGLADVDRLAAITAEAGVQAEVRWRGVRRSLPADIELSAYRIVQESLTNVARHSGTPACVLTIEYRHNELHLEVTDEGRQVTDGGSGHGITGMRERVGLLHGEFSAGPRPDGGYRVAATLPLPEPLTAEPRRTQAADR